MKRYLLFAGQEYYPSGGWFDFRGSYDDCEAAVDVSKTLGTVWESYWWYHVVDSTTGLMVKEGETRL